MLRQQPKPKERRLRAPYHDITSSSESSTNSGSDSSSEEEEEEDEGHYQGRTKKKHNRHNTSALVGIPGGYHVAYEGSKPLAHLLEPELKQGQVSIDRVQRQTLTVIRS
jgi:hypothetical protein